MNYTIKLAIRRKKTTATWQSVELWSTLQSLDSPTSYTNQSQWLLWINFVLWMLLLLCAAIFGI